MVADCAYCLELVAEDIKDNREHAGHRRHGLAARGSCALPEMRGEGVVNMGKGRSRNWIKSRLPLTKPKD